MSIDINDLVWVKLKREDKFLIIKETLTRIGIASKSEKKLTQTCHIFHKRGRYAIVHFKEMFLLDNRPADFTEEDKARRNTIIALLEEWDLVDVENPKQIEEPRAPLSQIKILPSKYKDEWQLVSKYSIGKKSVSFGKEAV